MLQALLIPVWVAQRLRKNKELCHGMAGVAYSTRPWLLHLWDEEELTLTSTAMARMKLILCDTRMKHLASYPSAWRNGLQPTLAPEPRAGRILLPAAGCIPPHAPTCTEHIPVHCVPDECSFHLGPAGGKAMPRNASQPPFSSTPLRSITSKAALCNIVSCINFYCNVYVLILKMRLLPLVYRPTTS